MRRQTQAVSRAEAPEFRASLTGLTACCISLRCLKGKVQVDLPVPQAVCWNVAGQALHRGLTKVQRPDPAHDLSSSPAV